MVIIGMKRNIIILEVLFCAIFIVSTSTAIPLINNTNFINKINNMEDIKTKLHNKVFVIDEFVSKKINNLYTLGFIENLINLLIKLLEFILNIASFISKLLNMDIGNMMQRKHSRWHVILLILMPLAISSLANFYA